MGIPISAGEFLGIWTQKLAAGGDAPAFTSGAVSAERDTLLAQQESLAGVS